MIEITQLRTDVWRYFVAVGPHSTFGYRPDERTARDAARDDQQLIKSFYFSDVENKNVPVL